MPIKAIDAVENIRSRGKSFIFLDAATNLPKLATTALSGTPAKLHSLLNRIIPIRHHLIGLKIIYVLQGWMQDCSISELNDNVNYQPLEYTVRPLFPPPVFAW